MEGGRSLLKKKTSSARQEQSGGSLGRDSSASRTALMHPGADGFTAARRGSKNLSLAKKSCFTFCTPQSNLRETNDSDVTRAGKIHVLLNGKVVTPRKLNLFNLSCAEGGANVEKLPSAKANVDKPTIQTRLTLQERATEIYFSLPSLAVVADSEGYWNTAKRNKEYEQLAAARLHAEKYTVNHSQTINCPLKSKELSAVLPPPVTAGVAASNAEIYDAFHSSVLPRGQTVQHQWLKKAKGHLDHAIQLPGSLISFNKPSTQYACATSSSRKNVTPYVAAAGGLRAGPTTRLRHNDVTTWLPQEITKTNARSATASPLHASGSTRNVRRKRPSLQKTGTPTFPAEHTWTSAADASTDTCPGRKWGTTLDPTQLGAKLDVMDKVLVQTRYHTQQMAYRDYPHEGEYNNEASETGRMNRRKNYPETTGSAAPSSPHGSVASNTSDDEEDSAPGDPTPGNTTYFEKVFSFNGQGLSSNTEVACLEWSTGSADLLAVGHGRAQSSVEGVAAGGQILFWSMQNPVYPERRIRTGSGVLCLSFSGLNPNLVAAGLADGHIALWDLRKKGEQPALQSDRLLSSRAAARHSDAVWDVRWVDRGPESLSREEILSIAGDGTVNQWALKKGLEKKVLISIKRTSNPFLEATRRASIDDHNLDSVAFRYATGLCIDISQQNPSNYLIGTDEGLIHRCSTSYSEQYVDTYLGHTAPVTKVRYNPFDNGVFLSSSDDGTIRLWCTTRTDSAVAILPPSASFAPVTDISWCPTISAAFAACSVAGHVEFWDLTRQQTEPVAQHSSTPGCASKNASFTSVRFSTKRNILALGDNEGNASVLRLRGMHAAYSSLIEQTEQLQSIISKRLRP